MTVTDRQRRDAIAEMIVAETSCHPGDLVDGRVHICERDPADRHSPAHRAGPPYHGIMRCVTLGVGAVVTAEPEHADWSRRTYGGKDRDGVFDAVQMGEAARYWTGQGFKTYGPFPRFSGSSETVRALPAPSGYAVKLVGPDVTAKIDHVRFHNGLDPRREGVRPTQFAVCAYTAPAPGAPIDLTAPVGVAAVFADSDTLWQIGIDVDDAHQARGLGLATASVAAAEVVSQGRVPYWGATNSNIRSHRTALGAGLVPTFVEVLIRPLPKPGA
jgi:hypothetical protein